MTRTLDSGSPSSAGQHALQPVGMLDRGPDGQAVAVGRGDEGVRLDGELGDHREVVGVLDDQVRPLRPSTSPQPTRCSRSTLVWRQRVIRPQRRVLDERRSGASAPATVKTAGSSS